jgi:cobaltochelatase CobN
MNKNEHKLVLIIDPDAPQAAIDKLQALKAEAYRIENIPANGRALMSALLAGDDEEMFQRGDYGIYFATLPRELQDSVNQRWGAPERDLAFRESRLDCGAFAMRAIRCGNVVVAMQPSRDDDIGPPSHGYLAFYAWIADGIRAHAIVDLSKERLPDAALCAVPPLA